MFREWRRDGYLITTDASRVDLDLVHGFLEKSYWAEGVSRENARRRVENSLVFGLYDGEGQVGFARVVTDYVTIAYLADVFVVEPRRGRGLGRWLLESVLSHDELRGIKWSLATRDAHSLYRRYGFAEPEHPERLVERPPPGRRAP